MEAFKWMNDLGKEEIPFFFIIDFEMEDIRIHFLDELENIFYDFNGVKNHVTPYLSHPIQIRKSPIPYTEYKSAFDKVYKELHYGNSYLLNLTKATEIFPDVGLFEIFQHSEAKYKLFYKDEFVVFSPEPFIKVIGNTISSYPMKGTANADFPDAAQKLIDNKKELSEHFTIVDLIRNDLSMVSENVRVPKFRYLETIQSNNKTLYQLSSKIEGDLTSNWKSNIGTILQKLLPAGSISGAPKRKTIEIIKEVENEKRGFYTGIMGLFDGQSLDTGVMIRFIEQRGEKYYYRSGGGITFQSDLNSEYAELIDKIYIPVSENSPALVH